MIFKDLLLKCEFENVANAIGRLYENKFQYYPATKKCLIDYGIQKPFHVKIKYISA